LKLLKTTDCLKQQAQTRVFVRGGLFSEQACPVNLVIIDYNQLLAAGVNTSCLDSQSLSHVDETAFSSK
jgi:hypothetical protein